LQGGKSNRSRRRWRGGLTRDRFRTGAAEIHVHHRMRRTSGRRDGTGCSGGRICLTVHSALLAANNYAPSVAEEFGGHSALGNRYGTGVNDAQDVSCISRQQELEAIARQKARGRTCARERFGIGEEAPAPVALSVAADRAWRTIAASRAPVASEVPSASGNVSRQPRARVRNLLGALSASEMPGNRRP